MLFSINLLLLPSQSESAEHYCNIEKNAGGSYYIRNSDEFIIESSNDIYFARPVLAEYSNFKFDARDLKSRIDYTIENIGRGKINLRELLKEKYTGTHIFLTGLKNCNNISSRFFLHEYLNSAIQVVIRNDNSYTGYLTELFNTPFIWIPQKVEGIHQTDAGVGSDCISFVIYGKRRQNYKIPYIHPGRIYNYTDNVSGEFYNQSEGIYYNKKGERVTLKNIRRGDILFFKAHVAVFYEDRGEKGLLDKDDLIIHSIKTGAHISTIENSNYYNLPIQILRWKE